jgi:transcriptional regulator with XRE-family HTH domain
MSFIPGSGYLSDGGRMTEQQAGSTVPRRQLGRYLRDLRSAAGLTVRAAARELERSEPTLWRIEYGQVSVRSVEVQIMCQLYGAGQETTTALMSLAKETKAKGWWQAYGDVVPDYFDLYVGLEAAASRIDWFETELVPGLLQTEDYAHALIQLDNAGKTSEEIARRMQVRMGRQSILRRPIDPPVIRVALGEQILRRPVSSPGVMATQLDRLSEVSELPNISVRVLPFTAGLHFGILSGPFETLRFPVNGNGEDTEPPTVYAEMFTGALYRDKPAEVARYDQAFGSIWEASLDDEASRELIHNAAEAVR